EEAQAVPSANVLFDWTANKLSHALDGLGASQDMAVAVLVKDVDGNVAIYPPQTFTTIAEAAITVGSAINATDVYGISMTVKWGAATSSSGDTLEYKVVKASSAAEIDTVDEADAAADIVLDWTEDTYSVEATELSPATTYVFAVLV